MMTNLFHIQVMKKMIKTKCSVANFWGG